MTPRATRFFAVLVNLASGACLMLLALAVGDLGPLQAAGWWALGSGFTLSLLAFPSISEVRDALLPGAFAALTFGLTAHALELVGVALVGTTVALALAVGPAASRLLRMTLPSPIQVGALSGGILGMVVFVSLGPPDAGLVLTVAAGLALTAHTLSVDRVVHKHRILGLNASVMLVAGGLLLAAEASTSGFVPPGRSDLPILVSAVALAGVALPLLRVRIAQRLGPSSARHWLPWFAVGAALAGWWTSPLSPTTAAGAAVLLASAWVVGVRPTGITEAEAFRIGP